MNGVCGGGGSELFSWEDVTQPFLEACQQLQMGELLHDEVFGLFEAMSAIEMMDPKMDSGMSTNTTPLTFQTAVEAGHLPLKDLSVADSLGLIDESLSSLVAWLEGHSTVQTVFTNLYTHQPEKIEDKTMQSFTYCLLKLMSVIRVLISRAGVYEEEDHQSSIFGFRLFGSEIPNLVPLLREAEEHSLKQARALKGKEEQEEEAEGYTGIASRLKFVRFLFNALTSIEKGEMSEGFKFLSYSKEQIQSIMDTVRLGSTPLPGKHMLGFEPLANQRLLPPTFPRYTKMKNREQSYSYFCTVIENVLSVTGVNQLNGFHATLNFFQDFSSRSPCLLSRSILQIMYTPLGLQIAPPSTTTTSSPQNPTPLLQEILKESCRDFHAPPALLAAPVRVASQPPSPLHSQQVKQCLDAFFNQCSRPFGLLIQSYGHNRARQREKIQIILEEFFTVQEEADKIDNLLNTLSLQAEGGSGEPHALYLSTWLIYHVLRLMIRYVLSGFELELYAAHEYTYVFFYLHDLLYPWLINCLHRADTSISEHIAAVEAKKKDKSKKKSKSVAKRSPKTRPYSVEIATYQANSLLCGGLFKFLVAVRKEGKIHTPNPQFDNESVRYEHRFGAFVGLLTPPLAPYTQYKEVVSLTEELNAKDLYLIASKDFGQARQILESVIQNCDVGNDQLTEVKSLATLAKTNLVVSSLLARDSVDRGVTFHFNLHPSYPLLKLS